MDKEALYDTNNLSGKLISEFEMDSEVAEYIEEIAKELGYRKLPDRPELRESIFDLVTDPPCHQGHTYCEFWDIQGHYCWLKNMHPNSKKCELLNQILALIPDIPKDKPPLTCEVHITEEIGASWDTDYRIITRCITGCPACQAQAQRESDIKHYEGD